MNVTCRFHRVEFFCFTIEQQRASQESFVAVKVKSIVPIGCNRDWDESASIPHEKTNTSTYGYVPAKQ